MVNLVLAIRSLDIGGAERQFVELVKHIDKSKFKVTVCTMYKGELDLLVQSIPSVDVIHLGKTGRYDFYRFYKNYRRILTEIKPDAIYSFLTEMNLFSLWCKPKKTKIIWGFRSAGKDWSQYGIVPRINFWMEKVFSKKVDKIIANSNASIAYHKSHGFNMKNSLVILNGIDSDRFKPDSIKREQFRQKYTLYNNSIAIGMIARIAPVKGYSTFVETAKKFMQHYDNVFFYAIGGGDRALQKACENILGEYNEKRFFWLGAQSKPENIYNGLDIVVSASLAEGFSNSIGEAMSCGKPCVVTDVGDSKLVVEDLGVVVAPNSVESLYNGLNEMINSDYNELGKKCRDRIVKNFSIDIMVKKTEEEIIKCVG